MALYTGQQTYISLYTGGGGLDLGFRLANPDAVPLLYVEREFPAASLLVDHIEAELLDPAPVWSDTGTLDCRPFAGKVDWIIGGFPCQPFSVAGKQAGLNDERWLWDDIKRLAVEISPRFLFLENTTGLLVRSGIGTVLGGLSEIGFDAEYVSVRASDVGAPHRRERVFILGNSRGTRSQIGEVHAGPVTGQGSAPVANTGSVLGQDPQPGRTQGRESSDAAGSSGALAHADNAGSPSPGSGVNRIGSKEDEGRAEQPQLEFTGSGEQLVNPVGKRGRGWHTGGEYAEHAFPPGPSGDWNNIDQRYWPAVKSEVRGMDDGLARGLARTQQLRILGNGVVPQQAALAFQILKERN